MSRVPMSGQRVCVCVHVHALAVCMRAVVHARGAAAVASVPPLRVAIHKNTPGGCKPEYTLHARLE